MTWPHQFWFRALSMSARDTRGGVPSPLRAEKLTVIERESTHEAQQIALELETKSAKG